MNIDEYKVGDVIPLGTHVVTKEEIIEFAEEFDQAPFHLDEQAARDTLLGGLSASGWHVCGILMRLICDKYLLESGSQGSPGVEYCKWLKPTLAGDRLTGTSTLVSKRYSETKSGYVIATLLHKLKNQRNEPVLEMSNVGFYRVDR